MNSASFLTAALLALSLAGAAPSAVADNAGDPATIEDLLRSLMERDALIYELQRRVDALERTSSLQPGDRDPAGAASTAPHDPPAEPLPATPGRPAP